MTTTSYPPLLCAGLTCLLLALSLAACDSTAPDAAEPHQAEAILGFLAKGQAKTEVCHRTDDPENPYVLIEVADPALDAHIAHGDAGPGEAVPGMGGPVFDDACQLGAVTCPCFAAADLDAFTLDFDITLFGDEVFGGERGTLLSGGVNQGSSFVEFAGVGDGETASGFACALYDESLTKFVEDPDISASEAEACRGLIYDEAEERSIPCEGDLCGQPYTP
jgi:hypothetical protein